MVPPPDIPTLVSSIPRTLGSYGPVLQEIEAALNDPQGSLTSVADAIQRDPDLTARLLKISNSSFYGFPRRLTTVQEAISLIGIQQAQDLIVASAVIATFAGLSPEFVDMRSFWQHSLACGLGARFLAMTRRMPKPDKFFVAGLLHDVGRLVLFCRLPAAVQTIFQEYHQRKSPLFEIERGILGYDHAQVGEALMSHWQYPPSLGQAVGSHHRPEECQAFPVEAAVVHVADHLVNAMQIGSSGERRAPPLKPGAWEQLQLPMDTLASLVKAIDDQLGAMEEAFLNHDGPPAKP
ncbi:MAG: HDOD domain-containing protein [Verrucomicrobia bacterium]|nr:HDOD domain-containing protein [Verrucomicrobiota bacterium]